MGWIRFFRRERWDEERAREVDSYLEMETADNLARGMAPEEARHAAQRKLGNSTRIREEIYRMNSIGLFEIFCQDLRYAARVLGKSPGFAAVAVLSLALGIGANSAMFSVIYAVLLRPLPYPAPQRLFRLGQMESHGAVSVPEYQFFKDNATVFAAAAGDRGTAERSLVTGERQEWVKTMTITSDFFRTLGVLPAMGREFNAEETHAGGPKAIVLSDGVWRRAFAADPAVLGRAVHLDDATYVVAGVLPPGFWFPQTADAFIPLQPTGSLSDTGTNTQMMVRLKDGVTPHQAAAEMAALTERIRRELRLSPQYRGLELVPYQDWLAGDIRLNLLLLFGAVGLLLLIACSNLASLLLARLASRQKEIAMRLALGSSRARLLSQFLCENLLLTLAGGAAGLLGAQVLLKLLIAIIPFDLSLAQPMTVDLPVTAFTIAIAIVTGAVFSLVPILSTARVDLQEALKAGGRQSGGVRQRARSVLVVAEVAVSMTLLVAAGLLIQSLDRLHREPLGFQTRALVTFSTPFAAERRRNPGDLWLYLQSLRERFQLLPGVNGVASVNILPLDGYGNMPTQREGHPENSIGGMEVRYVSAEYFEMMGIPIRHGRSFLPSDRAGAPPVILVNETVARRWWQDADPLGDQVVIGRFRGKSFGIPTPRVVVGVVADTKTYLLKAPPQPTVYVPAAQNSESVGSMTWILRTNSPAGLADAIRRAVAEVDPRQRVGAVRTMDEVVAKTTASSRFDAWLFALLAALALALTAIGVYGLLSFSVARRAQEIGTRMALGASRAQVLLLVLRQGFALILVGLVLGVAGALAATRSMTTLLFGVKPTDATAFAGVAVILLGAGLAASWFPAHRATKVDPAVALRSE